MASQVQHARALEALRALDAAKAETQQNTFLRNSLLDSEDMLLHLHCRMLSRKLHDQVDAANAMAESSRQSFEQGLSYKHTTRRPPSSRFYQDCGLRIPLEQLHREEAQYDTQPTIQRMQEGVELIAQRLAPSTSASSSSSSNDPSSNGSPNDPTPSSLSSVAAAVTEAIQRARTLAMRCGKVVDAAKVDSGSFRGPIESTLTAAQQCLALRSVKEPLRGVRAELERLKAINDEIAAKQNHAKQEGDIAANEGFMKERVTIMEAMCDLHAHMFQLLDEEEATTLATLQEDIQRVMSESTEKLATMRAAVDERLEMIRADLSKLSDAMVTATQDDTVAQQIFRSMVERSNQSLLENAEEEATCWAKIHELEETLSKLAVKRREEMDRRVKLFESEERRAVDMSHFTTFASQHHELLTNTSRAVEADELLCDMVKEYLQCVSNVAEQRLVANRAEVSEARTSALLSHLSLFREQYFHLGELMYKKERARDELDERATYARAQQELAMDSFNPKAKEYSLLRMDVDRDRAALQKEITLLQQKAELYVEAFKPSEKLLHTEGRSFLHPVLELQQYNKEKSRKMLEFYALQVGRLASSSAIPTEGERVNIDASHVRVAAERAALQSDRESLVRRKPPPAVGRDMIKGKKVDTGLSLPDE